MNALTRMALRSPPQLSAPTVLVVQLLLGALTIALGWAAGWQMAVVGLVLMQVTAVLAALGPWGGRPIPPPLPPPPPAPEPPPAPAPASKEQLTRLEERVDRLGARLAASTERARVEMLDALADARNGSQDHQS